VDGTVACGLPLNETMASLPAKIGFSQLEMLELLEDKTQRTKSPAACR